MLFASTRPVRAEKGWAEVGARIYEVTCSAKIFKLDAERVKNDSSTLVTSGSIMEQDNEVAHLLEVLQKIPETRIPDFLKELHAEMRALRDTELKIVPLFFVVSAFVVSGNMALGHSARTVA